MTAAMDWLAGAGGALGGLGGPAGLWAAYQQHRESHRRIAAEERARFAPPLELQEHVLRLRAIARDAAFDLPRGQAFWDTCGGREAVSRLRLLFPTVRDPLLTTGLTGLIGAYLAASVSVPQPGMPEEQVRSLRYDQAKHVADMSCLGEEVYERFLSLSEGTSPPV